MLDFIDRYTSKHGYAPTQQEIADHFGFSSLGTVQNYLVRLKRHGSLLKEWNARRGTQVIQPHFFERTPPSSTTAPYGRSPLAGNSVHIPLVGRVAAGRPIEAIETEETLEVPLSMLQAGRRAITPNQHMVLKIVGNSMIEDGILNGDHVIIRKQPTADNGQTIVALIDNEATIKRYYRQRKKIELHAANPAYKPIIIDASKKHVVFKIEGVLVGLIRRLQ